MDEVWLENVLARKHFEEKPVKVLNFKVAAAVGKGENYLSLVKRLNATVLLGSGHKRPVRLIVKDRHQDSEMRKITATGSIFEREITMYRDVLPKMDELLWEMDGHCEPLWPKCLSYRLYDQLVFEDLAASGYKTLNRKDQQDLAHCRLAVTKLAQFHALSKILLDRYQIPSAVFNENLWAKRAVVSSLIEKCNKSIIGEMKTWKDGEKLLERFEKAIPELPERVNAALRVEESEFVILNHGDAWTNNMLFKYDNGHSHPTGLKFIDFQLCSIGSPIYDLHYFASTSVRPDVLADYNDSLLITYCDSLKECLTKLNYDGPVPGFDEIKSKLEKTRVVRFWLMIMLTPAIIGDHEEIPDIEELSKTNGSHEQNGVESREPKMDPYKNLNDRLRAYLRNVIEKAVDDGII